MRVPPAIYAQLTKERKYCDKIVFFSLKFIHRQVSDNQFQLFPASFCSNSLSFWWLPCHSELHSEGSQRTYASTQTSQIHLSQGKWSTSIVYFAIIESHSLSWQRSDTFIKTCNKIQLSAHSLLVWNEERNENILTAATQSQERKKTISWEEKGHPLVYQQHLSPVHIHPNTSLSWCCLLCRPSGRPTCRHGTTSRAPHFHSENGSTSDLVYK